MLRHIFARKFSTHYVPGKSLPQHYYTTNKIYQKEMISFWNRMWLCAGYDFQIPKVGDYFKYDIGSDSLIILRDKEMKLKAFHNVCRHRGSRLIKSCSGNMKSIVCPYHQWNYGLDGKLKSCSYMNDLPNEQLVPASVESISGLIFVSPTINTLFNIEPARKFISPQLSLHGLDSAKIAYSKNYIVKSNWKIVYENNRECYHCNRNHPEYIQSNYDTKFIYSNGERILDPSIPSRNAISEVIAQYQRESGLDCTPSNTFHDWFRCSRQPLRKGYETESLDGKQVSRVLMSNKLNMGSLRIHTLPNFWIHCSGDHAVSAFLRPINRTTTEVKVDWLVHEDAVEGEDYELETLLPYWQKTSEQDWELCENHQRGVESSAYQPGELSIKKETGLVKYLNWYIKHLN